MKWHVQYPIQFVLDMAKNSANFVYIVYSKSNIINF